MHQWPRRLRLRDGSGWPGPPLPRPARRRAAAAAWSHARRGQARGERRRRRPDVRAVDESLDRRHRRPPGISRSRAVPARRHHAGVDLRLRRCPAGKAGVDGAGGEHDLRALSRRPGRGPAGPHGPRPGELSRLPRHHPGRGLAHGRGGGDGRAARGGLRRCAAGVDPGAGSRGASRAHLVSRLRPGPGARARPGRRGRPSARGNPARQAASRRCAHRCALDRARAVHRR